MKYAFDDYEPDLYFLKHNLKELSDWKKKNSLPFEKPFCMSYTKRNKKIDYIGLTKDCKKNKKLMSKFIQKSTDLVLVTDLYFEEGINSSYEDVSVDTKSALEFCKKYYVPYAGLEGDDLMFIKKMLFKDYTEEDLLLYIFLCLYVYFSRDMKENVDEFRNKLPGYMHDYQELLERPNFSYKKEFYDVFQKDFNYGVTSYDLIKPEKDSKYFMKTLAYEEFKFKNSFMAKAIFEYINQFNNVVIIAPQEYAYSQSKVFGEEFGKNNFFI